MCPKIPDTHDFFCILLSPICVFLSLGAIPHFKPAVSAPHLARDGGVSNSSSAVQGSKVVLGGTPQFAVPPLTPVFGRL